MGKLFEFTNSTGFIHQRPRLNNVSSNEKKYPPRESHKTFSYRRNDNALQANSSTQVSEFGWTNFVRHGHLIPIETNERLCSPANNNSPSDQMGRNSANQTQRTFPSSPANFVGSKLFVITKPTFEQKINKRSTTTTENPRCHKFACRLIGSRNILNILTFALVSLLAVSSQRYNVHAQAYESSPISDAELSASTGSNPAQSESSPPQTTATNAACFGGLQTFEKISMSSFENPSTSETSGSFGSGILVQQDDQALTSECVNLCRSQANCLSFVIDYNKFECKSYATTQQELQQEFDSKYQASRSVLNNSAILNNATSDNINGYGPEAAASNVHPQQLLPSSSSNYFEKICLDGVANRNQFSDVCGQGRLWTVERVVDSFLDGYVEKEVTNVNNKDECSKLCMFETQFVCRSADYDQQSRLCRLSKEDRRTQPQAMRLVPGSNRQYLENQCATPGPSSCVYETKKNLGIISMDALKFAQNAQDCQMKCNLETTFNCRSYSFHQQRCFLSGDDSVSLNSNQIKLPIKQGWSFGEKKCLVELCTKGIFSYEKITGYTLRSALSTPIDLMMAGSSSGNNNMMMDDLDRNESSQSKLRHLLPRNAMSQGANSTSNIVSTMMMIAANSNLDPMDLMHESSSARQTRSTSNLAITEHCRHSCDLGYLNCPAFTIDYKNNRCQRLDRNSQGRHHELVARDGFAYYEKICLRVPEIMSMCQDKYWIFERVIGYELAPRLYDKSLKFVQSRRDCEEYCLEEKQFQCRSALYNDETSDCKLSRLDRRLALQEGGYYRNFNVRISYLENQCVRDHNIDQKCYYDQVKDDPSYPTYTERIEMANPPMNTAANQDGDPYRSNTTTTTSVQKFGVSFCEQLCNENAKFECHSFGYYASTAQCFLSGDDSISAGELATTPSSGFTYYEKKCRMGMTSMNGTGLDDEPSRMNMPPGSTTTIPSNIQNQNPYLQPPNIVPSTTPFSDITSTMTSDGPGPGPGPRPTTTNNTSMGYGSDSGTSRQAPRPPRPSFGTANNSSSNQEADQYKCGQDHTFVYQRISGFEPIGGYLTLLVKNNERPGIVSECSELCKQAYECRAFVVDYASNQCFAMLENSSVGLLSLRQTLGKDYFEGFCVANHILLSGSNCRNKTWVMDKIVDQAAVGVQHQRMIADSDRVQCRQACLEERLFYCKSALFDSNTNECKLYSIDRESMPQMRLLFTKGVDFFENQCQIVTSSCPYDAIERDMTIMTIAKSVQARSTFDCEIACNMEVSFNCRSYTYLDQYPSLPNLCLLSSDSRSTSQRGSVKEHPRTLYAERNCYYRRPRYPGGGGGGGGGVSGFDHKNENSYDPVPPTSPAVGHLDPYRGSSSLPSRPANAHSLSDKYSPPTPPRISEEEGGQINPNDVVVPALGQGCEPHQYTFERTFGYDFRNAPKERAPISPTIGIAISCQQECLRRGDRCQSFVVDYALPYQNCFLIDTQVGANKKLLVRSPNNAYFEKVCLPRTGVEAPDPLLTHAPMMATGGGGGGGGGGGSPTLHHPLLDHNQGLDITPSYSHEPWSPQVPNQLPYYLQQQQLVQNYPSRLCSKLWSFERLINHNFTAPNDKTLEDILTRAQCEALCINEASFSCRAATYDYTNRICRLFRNTRRTLTSQLVDLESPSISSISSFTSGGSSNQLAANSHPGTAQVISVESEQIHTAASGSSNTIHMDTNNRRQSGARQLTSMSSLMQATAEPSNPSKNIDYLENTCTPEPSSCQYRQIYDQFSPYIDKVTHAISMGDCQRQCDQERLFSCKSINYDAVTKNCMLVNEDLISLNRGQQASLLPKKNTIYSEKGNCEMISVQCTSQEMLVSINFDSPFRGRIMAKGNPEHCFIVGDGQTNIQFPIIFGPKCNSRQEGHNTFVNEVVIQQHPVIMTESDKTVRVMCAFEAPEQTITLKSPSSKDNKTGIDVGTPETSRTRHDKQQFNSVVSNKAAPPSVILRILDQNGRDASMINLGDDLVLKIQMQMDGQNSALGIFARNLAARSSNGESLLLIDNDGCPVDHQVFPALDVDPRDGKSLISTFKAFRFPSSGLVNFEVQIRFCPEKCQPVDCHKGQKSKSFGRKKRDLYEGNSANVANRMSIIQSVNAQQEPVATLDAKSTVMNGKAFEYVRKLLFVPQSSTTTVKTSSSDGSNINAPTMETAPVSGSEESLVNQQTNQNQAPSMSETSVPSEDFESENSSSSHASPTNNQPEENDMASGDEQTNNDHLHQEQAPPSPPPPSQNTYQKSILMHVDEKIVPSAGFSNPKGFSVPHGLAPYGRFPFPEAQSVPVNSHRDTSIVTTPQLMDGSPESANHQSGPITSPPVVVSPPVQHEPMHDSSVSEQEYTTSSSTSNSSSLSLETQNDASNYQPQLSSTGTRANSYPTNTKDLPLKFSILVGENQAPTSNGGVWSPVNQPTVLVMNSSNVDLDHVVVPGKKGQFEDSDTPLSGIDHRLSPTSDKSTSSYNDGAYRDHALNHRPSETTSKRNVSFESAFDGTNSISLPEMTNREAQADLIGATTNRHVQNRPPSETAAASHDCQIEAGRSKLRTIIWTGAIVIALNICLVVLSLVMYFRKVHLRKNHNIVRSSSDCGTQISSEGRWPSVLLKSKNKLGTSINAHEHFFCKLNSNKQDGSRTGGLDQDYNWPNLSSSSSHSTISSLASPIPSSSIRINQMRPSLKTSPFDCNASLRSSNFMAQTNHKTILDVNSCHNNANNDKFNARYTNNIDEIHNDRF